MVWAALWIVYVVWGSTYLALRVLVETVPPLVGTGSRFLARRLAHARRARAPPPHRARRARRAARLPARRLAHDGRGGHRGHRRAGRALQPRRAARRLRAAVGARAAAPRRRAHRAAARAGGDHRLRRRRPAAAARRADRRRAAALAPPGGVLDPGLGDGQLPLAPRPAAVGPAGLRRLADAARRERRDRRRRARGRAGPARRRRLLHRVHARLALPRADRLGARLHRVRVAAAERADLARGHVRVREPGRRDRPRLADPGRGDHGHHARRRGGDRPRRGGRGPGRGAPAPRDALRVAAPWRTSPPAPR